MRMRMRRDLTGISGNSQVILPDLCSWLSDRRCGCRDSRAAKINFKAQRGPEHGRVGTEEVCPLSPSRCPTVVQVVLRATMEENGSLTSVKTVIPTPETLASASRSISSRVPCRLNNLPVRRAHQTSAHPHIDLASPRR